MSDLELFDQTPFTDTELAQVKHKVALGYNAILAQPRETRDIGTGAVLALAARLLGNLEVARDRIQYLEKALEKMLAGKTEAKP